MREKIMEKKLALKKKVKKGEMTKGKKNSRNHKR